MQSSSRERGQDYCLSNYGGSVFAFPVSGLVKVLAANECTLRANLPPPILGWAEVSGVRIPIAPLDHWLRGPSSSPDRRDHVVAIDSGAGLVGVAVERLRGMATILETEIRAPEADHAEVISGLWPQRTDTVYILEPRRFGAETQRWREQFSDSFRLSVSPPSAGPSPRPRAFCFFERRGRHFALPVLAAREVVSGEAVTPVPQAPEHVLGVVNLRGNMLALINADSFLGLPVSEAPANYEALVVESEGVHLGLLVDRVGDVRPIDLLEVQPAPTMEPASAVYRGVWPSADADVLLLDVDQLVARAVAATTQSFQRSLSALSGLEEDSDALPDATS